MPPQTYASSAAHSFRTTPPSTTVTATQTITSAPVLRLRATAPQAEERRKPRIQWAEDVVDNEGLGRKSSKVCCIYHAPHPVGESSTDESSSSSDDESSSDDSSSIQGDGAAQPSTKRTTERRPRRKPNDDDQHQNGGHDESCVGHEHTHKARGKRKEKARNAYERVPKSKGGSHTLTETNP